MSLLESLKKVKMASTSLACLDDATRNNVLQTLGEELHRSRGAILAANRQDLAALAPENPLFDRLLLTEARLQTMGEEIKNVIALPSPLGQRLASQTMPNGLRIDKIAVPLGVVAVIYESRPNVTIDVFSLCFKTGNACVLKGGKEAAHSNALFGTLIQKALRQHQIDPDCVYLFPPKREETLVLLKATGLVDVCIPRGSQALIHFVRNNASIPVIETGAGIVHAYFDLSGDLTKGALIIHNAKTRRLSVCNALDCLLIHKERLQDLPALLALLPPHHVEIFADPPAHRALQAVYPKHLLHPAGPADFGKEFLCAKLAVKTIGSLQEAIAHMRLYSSHHSELILTENKESAADFIQQVDAAVVYVNASTAFTDGGQFGMGAEIGISTQKLHARGPMGLDALTSYKWIVQGTGQVRDG